MYIRIYSIYAYIVYIQILISLRYKLTCHAHDSDGTHILQYFKDDPRACIPCLVCMHMFLMCLFKRTRAHCAQQILPAHPLSETGETDT